MNLKAIITDDELGAREVLSTLLQDFFPEISIVAQCENLPECIRAIRKHNPHVVFMDIEMPGYSGLEVHEFLNEDEINFELIFTTAYNEYALSAFKLSAIDYLLKPIQFDQLKSAIERLKEEVHKTTALEQLQLLKQNMSQHPEKRVCISTTEGKHYIPLNELIYLEADGSYTQIFTQNQGKIYAGRRLKYFEEMLAEHKQFMRVHRSYLVNLTHIKKLNKAEQGSVLLSNNNLVEVSNERWRELEQNLMKL